MVLPEKYRNAVLNENVFGVMNDMPDNSLDMIYGDPDYNVGIKYDGESFTTSFQDYIEWYVSLAKECLRILKPDGNLFFINYPKQNAHLRVKYLDDNAHSVHDYVWVYNTNVGHSPRRFTTAHRSILHVTKSRNNKFYKEQVAQPYQNPTDSRIQQRIKDGHMGRMPYSWINMNLIKNVSRTKTIHPCQIPESLSGLLMRSCTIPGDTIFILFGGSGSEVIQAKSMGLTYMTCELQSRYVEMIKSRLSEGRIGQKYAWQGRYK